MLIDWVTVVAQAINFLILAALLKWLLYDRIIGAIDKRNERIENEKQQARRQREQAEQDAEQARRQREEIENAKQQRLDEARADVEQQRKQMLEDARAEVDDQRRKWLDALERRQDAFFQQLRAHVAEDLAEIAGKAVGDLAGSDLEPRMVEVFIRRLDELDDRQRRQLAEAIDEQDGSAVIESAAELADDQQKQLVKAVREATDRKKAEIDFQVNDDLQAGLELRADGFAVGWNVRDYLGRWSDRLRSQLAEQIDRADPSRSESAEGQTHDNAETSEQEQDAAEAAEAKEQS